MMRRSLRVRPTVAVKPTLRARRPPETYVELLSKGEDEFRHYLEELEANPVFRTLIQDGLVSKVRFQGTIPRDKYEAYMDREVFQFLEQSGITQRDGWDKELLSASALQRIPELAQKYKVPPARLRRCVRYLISTQRDDFPSETFRAVYPSPSDGDTFDPLEMVREDTQVDLSDLIEIFTRFKDAYDLTEQDFVDEILHGELTPEELAARYGCTLREAEEVLEAADRVAFVETYETETHAERHGVRSLPAAEPVAHVGVNPDSSLAIQFAGDSVYVQRYRIRASEEQIPTEVKDLLSQLRFVNQRLSTLARLITVLCERQKDYLTSGNPLRLKPLSQADVARSLKAYKGDKAEHASTVCRLIRGKAVSTSHGVLPLTFFCQSKTDVIARVVSEHPDKSDSEIREILEREYDCKIARRTVTYHRGKRMKRSEGRPSGSASRER